jgi:hypothetical protein
MRLPGGSPNLSRIYFSADWLNRREAKRKENMVEPNVEEIQVEF